MLVLKGIAASPGIAIGKAVVSAGETFSAARQFIPAERVEQELEKFERATQKTISDLDLTGQKVRETLGAEYANMLSTHKLILQDPSLREAVTKKIKEEHLSCASAFSLAVKELAAGFEKIDDPFFRERRSDIFDVGKRLLGNLQDKQNEMLDTVEASSLLVAHDLFPSDTIRLQDHHVLGFCTDLGGKTSHTAILAQSLNIPAVVGLSTASKDVQNGDTIIVDGENGLLVIRPDRYTLSNYRKIQREIKKNDSLLKTINDLPVVTRDGRQVKLYINYDPRTDTKENKRLITDGLGLLRTEFLFMNTPVPPSEEAQFQVYLTVAKKFGMRPVVIRLADLGADKMPDFDLDELAEDDNPFMGCRGVRLLLKHPELLRTQLRAIIRAACMVPAQIKILIPRVSSVEEVRHVREAFKEVLGEFMQAGRMPKNTIGLGAMIEVPAAAIALEGMIDELDFLSIGTNDLIQYLVAVDRINPEVAHMYDPCHPAVGRTINAIIQTAHKRGKHVTICGEMAGDLRMIPLLLGWEIDGLSVSPRMYLRVKNHIRKLYFDTCSDLAQAALLMGSSEEIRNLTEENNQHEDS